VSACSGGSDVINAIVRCMATHAGSAPLQLDACRLLSRVASAGLSLQQPDPGPMEQMRAHLLESGTLHAAASALRAHSQVR
jgi:hypothetical protein